MWTIVVAGGGGSRFGGPKQFSEIAGRSVLQWSVQAATAVSDGVVVVLPSDHMQATVPGASATVAGGASRSASVRSGLDAVPDDAGVVLVHDAARPAASPELFRTVADAVMAGRRAVVPGCPVVDSLRHRDDGALDRDRIVVVQTPQGFDPAVLRAAHAEGGDASDDATLVERSGVPVSIVDGDPDNHKLTRPADALRLTAVLDARRGAPT